MTSPGTPRRHESRTGLVDIPFHARCHPRHTVARQHTLDWLHQFGMLSGQHATAEYDAMGLERLMAYFYPDATDSDLALATDLNAWFFVFDDQFDGPIGRQPDAVARQIDTMLRTMSDRGPAPGDPSNHLADSLADLWRRLGEDTPLLWQARFRDHWRDYLTAYHWEALNRTRTGLPSLPGFLRGRRDSIGVQPCLDLVERCGRYTLPQELHSGSPLAEMRWITADVVIFVNDIVSVDKELAAGDVNNSVIILHKGSGLSVERAAREVARLANSRVAHFQTLAQELTAALAVAGVSDRLRAHVADYVAGMRALMSGNLAWSRTTARYAEAGVEAATRGQRPWAHLFEEADAMDA
ncbi:isoafricanol synthase [Streptomyces sp. NPDC020719]|uniref:isoafricanol synthase n=1 Tax=unclassified Streptomyces TaxID=2593676 RepID=UPI0033E2A475